MIEVTRKEVIVDMTKRVYSTLTKKNLPIFVSVKGKLDEYVTSASEAEEGVTRMPDRSLRLKSERLVHDSSSDESEDDDDKENETETYDEFVVMKKTPKRK